LNVQDQEGNRESTLIYEVAILISIFSVLYLNLFIKYPMKYLLTIITLCLLACTKEQDPKVTEEILASAWRVEATRYAGDTLNPNAWHPVDYAKVTTSYDLYCVNDSRVNKSFLSKINCAYDETATSSVGVFSYDCARTVFTRDTVWQQLMINDIRFSADHTFEWNEKTHYSKHINLVAQPCSSIVYAPESDFASDVTGKWSLDEVNAIITVDYSPGYSRLDGKQINKFRVNSFTGDVLTMRLLEPYGEEIRLKKL
jgi:hypothetical protein